MASYFRQVPEFEYVNRSSDGKNIGDFTVVKNLFKRVKIREDILKNLAYFTQYQIEGDDRPDNVAFKVYGDETFDWVVLLSNNITNVQTEWTLTQQAFNDFLIKKYGSIEKVNNIHHYETRELKNDSGEIVFEFYVNEKNSETYLNSLSVGGITEEAVEEIKRLKIKEEEENLETKQGLLEAMLLENHVSNIRY